MPRRVGGLKQRLHRHDGQRWSGLRAASKPRQSRRSCVRTPCDREARMYAHHARPAQYRSHAPVQPMTQHNRGPHHHCTPTLATGTALNVGEEQQLISMVMALAPAHLRWPCFRSSRFAVASSMSSGKQTSCRLVPAAAARRGPGGRWLPALTSTRAAARAPVVAHRHRWALRHAMGGVPTALDCGRRSRRPSCVRSPGLPPTSHLPSTTRAAAAHAHAH